jgi:hypothetical protein
MGLGADQLGNISEAARGELLAYAALPPPRPPLRAFVESRKNLSWSAVSKASAASGFFDLLQEHDAAKEASRQVADAGDHSFTSRVKSALEGLATDPEILSDPTKIRSAILGWRAADELEKENPTESKVASLAPVVRAATRALTSSLPTPDVEGDFRRLTREQLRAYLWMTERVLGSDAPYLQAETLAPGDPGAAEPNLTTITKPTGDEHVE